MHTILRTGKHRESMRACMRACTRTRVEFVSTELDAIGKYIANVNLARCHAIRDSRRSITYATVSGSEILKYYETIAAYRARDRC